MNTTDLNDLLAQMQPLFDSVQHKGLTETRPLLAHYTSIDTAEKIIRTNEIWLSNPLFMNDLEEMRFGMINASERFLLYQYDHLPEHIVADCRARIAKHFHGFDTYYTLDTYVFCLSEHLADEQDGRLCMWRAYANQGNGAALIFDTEKLEDQPNSPLLLLKVQYGDHETRMNLLNKVIGSWYDLLTKNNAGAEHVDSELLDWSLYILVNVFRTFALTWKHKGFDDEKEWRLIYLPDRDVHKIFKKSKSYIVGRAGIEPKFMLKLEPKVGALGPEVSLNNLLYQIILGPALSSALSTNCFKQMLSSLGRDLLVGRVSSSTIPLRHHI